jgi:hypothetical protein
MAAPLSDLLRQAFERNPSVQGARLTSQGSIEAIPQASALPDPVLRFDYFGESCQPPCRPSGISNWLTQSFPFPGVLDQAPDLASRES